MNPAIPTVAVYHDTREQANCGGAACRKRILWARLVESGRRVCFSGLPQPIAIVYAPGGRRIDYLPASAAHGRTCPTLRAARAQATE